MFVFRTSIVVVLALSLAASPVRAGEEPMRWSPEALELNVRGSELSLAHDYQAAYDAYTAAYRAMPDPVRYHLARDWVFGSRRSSLISLYEETGEVKYLCQVRRILLEHWEELIDAFGEDAQIPDEPGIRRRLREVDADMRAHVPKPGETECVLRTIPREPAPKQVVVRTVPVEVPKPVPVTPSPRSRGLLAGGATGLAVGSALLGFMTYALVMRRLTFEEVHRLNESTEGPLGPSELATVEALGQAGALHRTTALATGISGGVLALTGIALVAASRARPRQSAVAPMLGPGLVGLTLHRRF